MEWKIFRLISSFLVLSIFCISTIQSWNGKSKFPLNNEDRMRRDASENMNIEHLERNRRSFCDFPMTCLSSPYRTIAGTCNNIENPFWGSSNRPYNRFLPPAYEDGFQSPRGSWKSFSLPRSRDISVKMNNTLVSPSIDDVTLMLMQWGQFCDHDLVFTTNDAGEGGIYANSPCCEHFNDSSITSPSCLPIDVVGDPFYKAHNVTCLSFVRSSQSFCIWPEREQNNEQTAYLDASQVYGADSIVGAEVREQNSWKLKSGPGNECTGCPFQFLPTRNNSKTNKEEFFAGDERVEEQPGLTSIHTIFVRMHNHLGQILRNKHPEFSNDTIFEEVRKIAGALMQQITYNEFLPLVLGTKIMTLQHLVLQRLNITDPYFFDYDKNVDATIPNVLPTAAFRFGHSLIADMVNMPGGEKVKLAESFENHFRTTLPGTFPSHFLRGVCTDRAEEMDHKFASAIQNFLLAKPPFKFGSDLFSRNIERGREHGIPAYVHWANTCRSLSTTITRFNHLSSLMPSEIMEAFRILYSERLGEIDLFPAGCAENSVLGGLVGPTFACILAETFFRLKVGDRYWFENPNVFTKEQLRSIRNTKLSTIICKYTDAPQLQEFVMKTISTSNRLKNCSDLGNRGVMQEIAILW